ncbi:hypothetical protein GCM10007887_43490 [Methylobacterium haplocladii]|nr:hypothetical protein GCM10007887_43490 [Methylobacterium haplocladii]
MLVKGFVEEVVILCGGTVIARHLRSYPHLPRTIVRTTVAADDTVLVPEAAA